MNTLSRRGASPTAVRPEVEQALTLALIARYCQAMRAAHCDNVLSPAATHTLLGELQALIDTPFWQMGEARGTAAGVLDTTIETLYGSRELRSGCPDCGGSWSSEGRCSDCGRQQ